MADTQAKPKKIRGDYKQVKMGRIYAVRVPPSLENGLQAYCTTNNIKPSKAIRNAVVQMLKNQYEDEKKE